MQQANDALTDSIKLTAKTFASSVVAFYDETLKEDLIPGLFSDDYYWWESGLAFNTLIEYYGLTNDSQFNARISQALQHQLGDFDASYLFSESEFHKAERKARVSVSYACESWAGQ